MAAGTPQVSAALRARRAGRASPEVRELPEGGGHPRHPPAGKAAPPAPLEAPGEGAAVGGADLPLPPPPVVVAAPRGVGEAARSGRDPLQNVPCSLQGSGVRAKFVPAEEIPSGYGGGVGGQAAAGAGTRDPGDGGQPVLGKTVSSGINSPERGGCPAHFP